MLSIIEAVSPKEGYLLLRWDSVEAMKKKMRYSFKDVSAWPEDERWELIDGTPYLMAQPSVEHEDISREIFVQLANFLKGRPCKVYDAIGVRLNAEEGDDTFVIPDISVVCDKSKLADGKSCIGAPDMVVEILSLSTAGRDRLEKFNMYLEAGVREYWIVDPETKIVNVNTLENGKYVNSAYGKSGTVQVHVLDGCTISLEEVFAET